MRTEEAGAAGDHHAFTQHGGIPAGPLFGSGHAAPCSWTTTERRLRKKFDDKPLWPGTPPVVGRAVLRYPGQGTGSTNEIRGQLPELLQIHHSDNHASNCTRAEFTIPRTISSKLHRGSQPS